MQKMTKKLATQCKIILQYLETNKIIGEEKAIISTDLCKILKERYKEYFTKEFDSRALRTRMMYLKRGEVPEIDMVRIVGSSQKGYFLAKRGDNSLELQKRLAVSYLETAVKLGIPKEYFYKILNELDNKNVVDNQCVLPITNHTHKIAHIYSNDLLEENGKE